MVVQRNTARTRKPQLSGSPVKKKQEGKSEGKFRIRWAPEKEYRALARIAAALQALCLFLVFGATDVLAKHSKFDRGRSVSLSVYVHGDGMVTSSPEGLKCSEGICSGEFPRGTVVRLTAQPAEGQILARWRGACGGSGEQCRVRLRRPQRVSATFRTPPPIPLRVFLRGEGKVTSSPPGIDCSGRVCRGRFPQGSLVTLYAEPGENQSFRRWRGACRGTEECVVNMRRPRNVLARFVANPPTEMMTLAMTIRGDGSVLVSAGDSSAPLNPGDRSCSTGECEMKFPPNTALTLTPIPGEGQEFTEWGGACEGQESKACSVTLTTSLKVAAAFENVPPPKVTLTVNVVGLGRVVSEPKGIDCQGGICPGEFDPGTIVSLLPTPGEGHEFGEWTGACAGKGECKVAVGAPTEATVAATMEVTATFVLLPPPNVNLSVGIEGEGTVTSAPAGISCPTDSCTFGFPSGDSVTLTATANPGHAFSGWSHPSCTGTDPCTVPLTAATEITATFVPTFSLVVTLAGGGEGSVTSDPSGIFCPPTQSCEAVFTGGTEVTLTAAPGPGNEFSGWAGACAGVLLECTVTINAATLVSANFVPEPTGGLTNAEAMRFLEQSTWGPNAAAIAHLRNVGINAFLNEQFQAVPSMYPDPNTELPLRDQWFFNAFQGQDQLRQRVAFALSQLFVVSANTVGDDEAMIPYQRMLHENAFGNFLDLMHMVTLSPTMGRFLDMVNNDKTDPESGLNPNENYARELLQLFTVGTTLLNIDGSNRLDADGQPIQPYDQDVIINLSRVFTGWTYPPENPAESRWRNSPHYNGPMVAFEEHHDTGAKELMNGFPISAFGTAQHDLDEALRHIFNHPNVGPFVATRLIRNLVTSNPSPDYIRRVATVFNDGLNGSGVRGDMQAVITAILTDPEAAAVTPNGGHLREPILYAIALLRALNANVELDNVLYDRTQEMGQSLFSPPSVFNYFSPLYVIPGTSLFGPEYQIHTLSTSIARANFVDRVVRDNVGGGVSVDLSVFNPVAADADQLIDAVSQTLLHESLSDAEKQIIRDALNGVTNQTTRIRTVVYLIATSGRYQVQH